MQLSSFFHQTLPACNMNIFQTPQIEFGRDFCCTFLVSKLNLRCWWHHCDIIRVMFSSRSRRHHTTAFTAWEQLNMSRKLIFMFETRGVNCEYWKHWPQIAAVLYDAHYLKIHICGMMNPHSAQTHKKHETTPHVQVYFHKLTNIVFDSTEWKIFRDRFIPDDRCFIQTKCKSYTKIKK